MNLLIFLGILFCLSQSAVLSGLNLALFSLSKLELEVAARKNDPHAKTILRFREDTNHALATILWGNVVLVDSQNEPRLALKANNFIREALFAPETFNPYRHCHRPMIARDAEAKPGKLIQLHPNGEFHEHITTP